VSMLILAFLVVFRVSDLILAPTQTGIQELLDRTIKAAIGLPDYGTIVPGGEQLDDALDKRPTSRDLNLTCTIRVSPAQLGSALK
jgi:hypothetical protein